MIQLADGNMGVSSYFEDPELGVLTSAEQKRKFSLHLSKTDMEYHCTRMTTKRDGAHVQGKTSWT
jgi:hypothetical protein